MCGHEFMYHNLHQLQRHRLVWRCSTCGREAYRPLDCCTRPDVASRQQATLGRQCARWLGEVGRWALTSLGALLRWDRQPMVPTMVVPDDSDAEGVALEATGVGAEDGAETAVTAGEPVAAGTPV